MVVRRKRKAQAGAGRIGDFLRKAHRFVKDKKLISSTLSNLGYGKASSIASQLGYGKRRTRRRKAQRGNGSFGSAIGGALGGLLPF